MPLETPNNLHAAIAIQGAVGDGDDYQATASINLEANQAAIVPNNPEALHIPLVRLITPAEAVLLTPPLEVAAVTPFAAPLGDPDFDNVPPGEVIMMTQGPDVPFSSSVLVFKVRSGSGPVVVNPFAP